MANEFDKKVAANMAELNKVINDLKTQFDILYAAQAKKS